MSHPSYTRILNNALVFGTPGREPMVAKAHVVLVHGCTSTWLMIEFPHWRAAEFPFPTFEVNGSERMAVFQLPPDFEFTYCNLTRACRWSVKDCEFEFSLVLAQHVDYVYIRGAIAGCEEEDKPDYDAPPAVILQSNLENVAVVFNEITAATRDPSSVTVRGRGKEGLLGTVITISITLPRQ